MKYYLNRFKKPIKATVELILIFGIALLVLLYYLGYYDLSFLDRYKDQLDLLREGEGQQSSSDSFSSLISTLEGGGSASEETPWDTEQPEDSSDEAENTAVSGEEKTYTNVSKVYSASVLPDRRVRVETIAERAEDGYSVAPTNKGFTPGVSVLGRMTFSFQLPEDYSLRDRTVTKQVVVDPGDDYEKYVTTEEVEEARPAVECYMGYLLIDNGEKIVLCSSEGEPLCSYNPSRYIPAYVRDREDRPLFYRTRSDGSRLYFNLSANGQNFVVNAYDETVDGRGLAFDYPADYGKSDTDKYFIDYDAAVERYAYFNTLPETPQQPAPLTPEPAADEEEIPAEEVENTEADSAAENEETAEAEESAEPAEPEEPKPEPLTEYRFTSAHPFAEGLAAVTTTANRGAYFFINETGENAFTTFFNYKTEFDRDVNASYMPPLTNGIESIGFFRFDHGLTRVRKQVIDYYYYFLRPRGSLVRVAEDYDVLIRSDGTEYALPSGYTLEGYSEGRILLSKDGYYGFMDYTGAWIAQPIYTDAKPFIGGLAQLKTEDGRWGMIDSEGNIVLQFTYDHISQLSSGVIAVYREENGWAALRIMQ